MRGMIWKRARRWSAYCVAGTLVANGAAWAQEPAQQVEAPAGAQPGVRVFVVDEGEQPGLQVLVVDASEQAAGVAPKLWLGLVLEPATDALRSQLGLPPEQGLVVREVVAESPAAAAGVQPFDVLLTVNETPVNDMWALIRLVEEAGAVELSVQIVRQGERQELKLTPTERPAAAAIPAGAGPARLALPPVAWQQLGAPMHVFMGQPGQIVARAVAGGEFALPDDLHVIVRKHGAEPTVIVVERGDERWETEASKLDELPEDVRAQVTTYLHSLAFSGAGLGAAFSPVQPAQPIPGLPAPHVVPFPGRAFEVPAPPGAPPAPEVLQRLDELQRQLQELRERIDSQERESSDRPDDSGVRSSFINFRCA